MPALPEDLKMRTVVFQGDIDQMGVVLRDGREERVEVTFDGKGGEWVARTALEDVTNMCDLAYQWGYTTENHAEE